MNLVLGALGAGHDTKFCFFANLLLYIYQSSDDDSSSII